MLPPILSGVAGLTISDPLGWGSAFPEVVAGMADPASNTQLCRQHIQSILADPLVGKGEALCSGLL
jgi:hypothetical protein